jgi:membrane protein insertase Oxa1/YidC/SpoIIIJ
MLSFTSIESAAYTLVFAVASALSGLGGAAAAIAVCTVAVRLLLLPLTMRAVRRGRPAWLQLPVSFVLYRLFYLHQIGGHANALLGQALFGVPLGARFLVGAGGGTGVLVFAGLFLALALLARWAGWWARRVALATGAPTTGLAGWIRRIAPFATVLAAAFVPLAAGIYLVTTQSFTAAETMLLRRTNLVPCASS